MGNIKREWQAFEIKRLATQNNDLYITECGFEKCVPQHSYGPAKRSYFLIHFVIDGSGNYEFNNKIYKINKNQGFIIFPGDTTKYTADKETPWHYYWVGFNGIKARQLLNECGIDSNNPVICSKKSNLLKKYIMSLYHTSKIANFNMFTMIGFLYLFFSSLDTKKIKSNKEEYIDKALNYIRDNFINDIKIEDIAKMLFLERSYLYRIFIENLGISPLNYLIKYRLNTACELLKYSNHTITDISGYVGFSSSSSFCKAFKKEFNQAPLHYRKSIHDNF